MVVTANPSRGTQHQEEGEASQVLEKTVTLTNHLGIILKGEMVATVIACNGIQMSTTTTEPEAVVVVPELALLLDLVVNTVAGMVVWVLLAKVLTKEVLAKHMQALEEAVVEMEGEAPTTALQADRP